MAKKSNFNINDLTSWGIVPLLVTSVVIVAAIVFAVKYFLVDDVTKKVDGINKKILVQEKEYNKHSQTVAVLPEIREEIEVLKGVKAEMKKFLPTNVSMPTLIDNVYLVAEDNNITFDFFAPSDDIVKEYYTIKPIKLSAKVGFINMATFVEQVTSLERIMNVESVNFTADEFDKESVNSNRPLNMTAELRTYIFNEDDVN